MRVQLDRGVWVSFFDKNGKKAYLSEAKYFVIKSFMTKRVWKFSFPRVRARSEEKEIEILYRYLYLFVYYQVDEHEFFRVGNGLPRITWRRGVLNYLNPEAL